MPCKSLIPRTLALLSLIVVLSAGAVKAADSPSKDAGKDASKPAGQGVGTVENEIIAQTNAQRVQHGLRPLLLDFRLMRSARQHAAWMTNRHVMQHSNINVGENIAMGQRSSGEAMQSWMNSPGHRANILNTGYTHIGVAAYTAPDGTSFWCQQFLP